MESAEVRIAGPGLRPAGARGLRHDPGAAELPARPGCRRDRGGAGRSSFRVCAEAGAAPAGGDGAGEVHLLHLARRCRAATSASSSFRTSWRSASSCPRGMHATWRWAASMRLVSRDHRAVQGLHQHAEIQRLPEPAHGRDPAGAAQPEDRDPDPHGKEMQDVAENGVAAHWLYKQDEAGGPTAGGREAVRLGVGPAGDPGQLARRPTTSWRTRSSRTVFRPGLLLHAERAS